MRKIEKRNEKDRKKGTRKEEKEKREIKKVN